jgi:hypothetical protein
MHIILARGEKRESMATAPQIPPEVYGIFSGPIDQAGTQRLAQQPHDRIRQQRQERSSNVSIPRWRHWSRDLGNYSPRAARIWSPHNSHRFRVPLFFLPFKLVARGTSTLLNNALLSAHFVFADNPIQGSSHSAATLIPATIMTRRDVCNLWYGTRAVQNPFTARRWRHGRGIPCS